MIIGQQVEILEKVAIRDLDNHNFLGSKKSITAPIITEYKVRIGINVTILKGVITGRGSLIAAGSLVKKDFPQNTLAGGVHAKILKENVTWN